jgi:hypothetical protein
MKQIRNIHWSKKEFDGQRDNMTRGSPSSNGALILLCLLPLELEIARGPGQLYRRTNEKLVIASPRP